MKPYTCSDVDQSLWLYIDRELSASELSRISSHLRDCPACSSLYHERAKEARQYRMAFADTPFGDKLAGRLRRKMVEEGYYGTESRGASSSLDGSTPQHRDRSLVRAGAGRGWGLFWLHRGRRRRLVTVAAMLCLIPIIVVIGVVSNVPTRESLGWISAEQGAVFVKITPSDPLTIPPQDNSLPGQKPRDDQAETLVTRATAICAGLVCSVREGGIARIRLHAAEGSPAHDEETWASVKGPAVFSVDLQATRKRFLAHLDEGRFETHVVPRGLDEVFQIETPHSRVTVVGTRFDLNVRPTQTLLLVHEGKVRFEHADRLPGQAPELVTSDSGPFVAREGETRPVAAIAALVPAAVTPRPEDGTPPAVQPGPSPPPASSPPAPPNSAPTPDPPPLDLPRPGGVDLDQPVTGDTK